MKETKAWKCDHCSKVISSAGAMAMHEKRCRENRNARVCKNCVYFSHRINELGVNRCYCLKRDQYLVKSYFDHTQFKQELSCEYFMYESKLERVEKLMKEEE